MVFSFVSLLATIIALYERNRLTEQNINTSTRRRSTGSYSVPVPVAVNIQAMTHHTPNPIKRHRPCMTQCIMLSRAFESSVGFWFDRKPKKKEHPTPTLGSATKEYNSSTEQRKEPIAQQLNNQPAPMENFKIKKTHGSIHKMTEHIQNTADIVTLTEPWTQTSLASFKLGTSVKL
jgi:hypothetical protein